MSSFQIDDRNFGYFMSVQYQILFLFPWDVDFRYFVLVQIIYKYLSHRVAKPDSLRFKYYIPPSNQCYTGMSTVSMFELLVYRSL